MRKPLILTAVILALIVLGPVPTEQQTEREERSDAAEEAAPPVPSYVGAKKCKVCHLETYNSWQATKHAKAIATLNEEDARNPECLACHTTGFGDGGYGAEGVMVDLAGVQCEACHGAGSLYSRSSVMRKPEMCARFGLVRPDSLTCIRCHNAKSPTFKGFAYKAGLSAGTHSRKPRANR